MMGKSSKREGWAEVVQAAADRIKWDKHALKRTDPILAYLQGYADGMKDARAMEDIKR
jgi:hypothetical protein